MRVNELSLPGVFEVTLAPIADERGFFMRAYDQQIFRDHGLHRDWVQENHARNACKHTVRGIHFQLPPDCETKLVRVIRGEVLDVFVDLRMGSPTFGQWGSSVLSAENKKMLFLPKGFGHGIVTLADETEMYYKVDAYYAPHNESNIIWNDPDLAIDWPIDVPAVISDRDAAAPTFAQFVDAHGGLDVG